MFYLTHSANCHVYICLMVLTLDMLTYDILTGLNTDVLPSSFIVPPSTTIVYVPTYFPFMWPCIIANFFVIKPTRCTKFTNLFCYENSTCFGQFVCHHQDFIHCTLISGINHTCFRQAFEENQDGKEVISRFCSKAVYKHARHLPLLNVLCINSWWCTEKLSETCRFSW